MNLKFLNYIFWIIIYFIFYKILILKSNDLESYYNGLALYNESKFQDFNLVFFYFTDNLFFYFINILSKITRIDGEFILKYLGLFLAIIKLFFFKIKFNKSFNLISFLYLINFFYLFDVNQLRESLVITIFLLIILFRTHSNLHIILLSFFHKSAFILFILNSKISFKNIFYFIIITLIFLNIYLALEYKWLNTIESLNFFTFNTLIYFFYFYTIYFQKKPEISTKYLYLILFTFFFFVFFRTYTTILAIRLYELGLFFILLSSPQKIKFTSNTIYFYLGFFIFSIYNFIFLYIKYI
jgi:hypothetical protein